MSSLSISMTPEDGSTMRLIMRSSVVFPQPDEPTKTVVLRDGITTLKLSTAWVPSGYSFETDLNSIIRASQATSSYGSFLAWGRESTLALLKAKHYSERLSFPTACVIRGKELGRPWL